MENFMKVYYILLPLFALASPLFSMEKAPYTPGSGKRLYELLTPELDLDSNENQSSPKTPRLLDEIEPEPLTPFLNVLAPTPLNSQMEQEAPQSIVQAQISTEVPTILQTFFNAITICRICSENIGKKKLLAHFNSQHQGQKPFKCPACDYASPALQETSTHIIDKHVQQYDPQECWLCLQNVSSQGLTAHFKVNHPDLQPHKCPQCPYTTGHIHVAKKHIASHFYKKFKAILEIPLEQEAEPEPTIQVQPITEVPPILQTFLNTVTICRICSADIGKNKLLLDHFNSQHQGQKPFKCPACDYASPGLQETSTHIIDKHVQQYNPKKCWLCLKKISSRGLPAHFKVKHPDLQPYKCPQCPYTAGHIHHAKKHIASHFYEKFKATSAQEDLAQLISLPSTPTVLSSLTEPPTPQASNLDLNIFNSYPCFYEKCGQVFSTKQKLIEHLNSEH